MYKKDISKPYELWLYMQLSSSFSSTCLEPGPADFCIQIDIFYIGKS
jgi:hypothetical protein